MADLAELVLSWKPCSSSSSSSSHRRSSSSSSSSSSSRVNSVCGRFSADGRPG